MPDDAIICGGAAIYDLTLELCDEILVTTVKQNVEGDTFF
ncbi:MAG: dihydrofolate reductase, partial [Gimesia chilikensis]